ncbi:gp056 [Erwinia phage vB_EamP-S6]|uniref:Gp056 n=1 Tax=Erwinia phage vB_EamP-S6 TaxID=1051675 RepID=G0YQE8_9CAUD|nr:gp056 [Erwinia phage vB_EamP-S6]AEJ81575.1 gp056 [Erwinia phage vB_EamP-S6]
MINKTPTSVEWIGYVFSLIMLGAGVCSGLWYTTRQNGERVYNLFHIGFVTLKQPYGIFEAKLMVITIVWFNFKIGLLVRSKS